MTANVAGSDVASFVARARKAVAASVNLPAGVYLEFSGAAEAQSRSQRDLAINSLIAGVGIVLLLVDRHPQLPPSSPGAGQPAVRAGRRRAGGLATGGRLSLGALVGFVTLFGITLRNSILMIAHYEHLVEAEGASWGLATAIRGAADRLLPILMTSIVTALGVLPLALGMGDPGREIEGPMAVVILGGLLTSMALNLLVLPTLALRYGRFEAKEAEAELVRSGL